MIPQKTFAATLLALLTLFLYSRVYSEDIIIDIGNGSGAAGSKSNTVRLSLDNASDIVKGIQVYICDEGNYLTVSDCVATGRASQFSCMSNECNPNASSAECRPFPGCANIVLYSTGNVLKEGVGPVAVIKYEVFEDAPSGCFDLTPRGIIVSDQNKKRLSVVAERGEFCMSGGGGGDDTTTTVPTTTSTTPATTTAEPSADSSSSKSTPDRTPQSGSRISSRGLPASGDKSMVAPLGQADTFSRQQGTGKGGGSSGGRTAQRSAFTATPVAASPEAGSRLVISPPVSAMSSGGVVALDARTIADGKEVPGKYQWEIFPASTIGSTVDADGVFTAGINTSSSPVEETIRVTDTSQENISATATISIEGPQASPEGCALSLSPSSAEISPGSIITFTPQKRGRTCDEGSYQWRVSSKIGSTITQQGVYTAGMNRNSSAALDIVMVKDNGAQLSTDALLTVLPGERVAPADSPPHNKAGSTGSSIHPGILMALATLIAATGVVLVRKKIKR